MQAISKGRYTVRLAGTPQDVRAAQALRWRGFLSRQQGTAPEVEQLDADAFDAICQHALVEDTLSGSLVCCFRLLPLRDGSEISRSYSAQYYDLTALEGFDLPMLEMGRFCIDPAFQDPDILRLAWGAVTRFVDETGVGMLFGCSSFTGTDWAHYRDSLALLASRHLAPTRWAPCEASPSVVRYPERLAAHRPDAKLAQQRMPPLLRTYLLMGGWVSDHAVIDPQLDTFHVLTGLEIAAIPPARARALRLIAG